MKMRKICSAREFALSGGCRKETRGRESPAGPGGGIRTAAIILAALLATAVPCGPAAEAEPLKLVPSLEETVTVTLNDGKNYVHHYSYPQLEETEEAAEVINAFYGYVADDAAAFEIPMNADYYSQQTLQGDVTVDISYQVTCNNDDYFSVLLTTVQDSFVSCAGNTFSRQNLKPGSTVALPLLLGLLDSGESDTWLQDRQTAKADALVREMVWQRLKEMKDVALPADFTEESLEYGFFPEEDFFLDETGNPVFFLQPGFAEDSGRLLTFPIPIEEILDEM